MRTEKIEESGQLLSSWKEIAAYLERTVRTCQRLESAMGLPVHRLDGSPKAHVFAYRSELDAWMAQKVDEHEQGHGKSRHLVILGLGAVAAVAVVAALLIFALRPGPASRSIAVLPFENLSSEPRSEEYTVGLTEDLTTALARIRGLQVPSRIATASVIKKKDHDPRETGRTLNVRYLLEGSTQVAGERLRVTARLFNARNGFQVWTETYDRRKDDFFEVRDGITGAVVDRIGIILSARERSTLRERPTADMQAYEYYLTGRYLLGRPWPETPLQAIHFFDLALGRDPKFALAHVGIAWAYMNMISQFLARPNDVGSKAERAATKALALAPDLPEAIALDAWARFLYRFEWNEGEKGLARAVELKPDDSMIRGLHAMSLFTQRKFAEARAEIKRALGAEPFSPLMPVLSAYSMWIHLYTGRSDEVLAEFQRIQAVQPNFEFAHYGAGMALLKLGRLDEGIETLRKACAFPHTNGRPDAALAFAYVLKGDRQAAEAIYARLLDEYRASGLISPVNLAWIQVALGDLEAGYRWLDTAIQEHDPSIPFIHIYVEGVLPEIARQQRFQAIMDRLDLPR